MGLLSAVAKFAGSAAGGPLIGLGGAILGGILDRRGARKAQKETDQFNDPAAVRQRYEAAGFNPLLGIQNLDPSRQASGYTPTMGSLIQNGIASYQAANAQSESIKLQRDALDQERDQFNQQLQAAQLRPRVSQPSAVRSPFTGIRRNSGPATPDRVEAPHIVSINRAPDNTGRMLTTTLWSDDRRDIVDTVSGQPVLHVQQTFLGGVQPSNHVSGVALNPEAAEMDGAAAGVANITAAIGSGTWNWNEQAFGKPPNAPHNNRKRSPVFLEDNPVQTLPTGQPIIGSPFTNVSRGSRGRRN